MKRLILQTYTNKDVPRKPGTLSYSQNKELEKASQRSLRLYANSVGADYELFTGDVEWQDKLPGAHWHRMMMFDRPDYDEVLYVDCDVLVNPLMLMPEYHENIFDDPGNGVYAIHPSAERKIGWPGGINMGVLKFNREEAEIMKDKIHDYYQPEKNQEALNNCWRDHIGMPKLMSCRWNVTHIPLSPFPGGTNFRHFPGSQRRLLDQDVIFAHWKDQMRGKSKPFIQRLQELLRAQQQ